MNTLKFIPLSVLCIALLASSCKKKSDAPVEETPAPTTTTGGSSTNTVAGFFWQENGGAVITADSAYWTFGPPYTGIKAFKAGYGNFFEINWAGGNNTAVGTKTLAGAPNPDFTFLKGAVTYTNSATQNLQISASNNVSGSNFPQVSGSFSLPVSGGSITSISGTFNTLPHKY